VARLGGAADVVGHGLRLALQRDALVGDEQPVERRRHLGEQPPLGLVASCPGAGQLGLGLADASRARAPGLEALAERDRPVGRLAVVALAPAELGLEHGVVGQPDRGLVQRAGRRLEASARGDELGRALAGECERLLARERGVLRGGRAGTERGQDERGHGTTPGAAGCRRAGGGRLDAGLQRPRVGGCVDGAGGCRRRLRLARAWEAGAAARCGGWRAPLCASTLTKAVASGWPALRAAGWPAIACTAQHEQSTQAGQLASHGAELVPQSSPRTNSIEPVASPTTKSSSTSARAWPCGPV
jgi:hypothetical protein